MEARPYRVLVSGSRDWPHEGKHADAVRMTLTTLYGRIKKAWPGEQEPILVHGTAAGVDELAAGIWIGLGGDVEPHPADWKKWGRQAGYVRNKEMVDLGADMCLVFIHNNSRGASNTAKLADKAGIRTHIVEWNDSDS